MLLVIFSPLVSIPINKNAPGISLRNAFVINKLMTSTKLAIVPIKKTRDISSKECLILNH